MRTCTAIEMLAAVVSAFVLGGLFSLVLAASAWLYTAAVVKRENRGRMPPFNPPILPLGLREAASGGGDEETCQWFNLVTAFLFQELRDSPLVKSFILTKVHKEFSELMFTRREGRMLEQLTVRDYDFGSSLPLFSRAVVLQQRLSSDLGQLEELCLGVDVEYSGGFRIDIDADLIFNRVAYVAIHVLKVKGRGQLQFTTVPHTHWSFSFCEDPELILEVESTFEGRSFPQLSSFMEAQLRRWVRQKHTLPARKTRHKPFFSKPQPQSQLEELYVHDQQLTVGRLTVEVMRGSQLAHPPSATATFCTISTSSLPWQPLLGIWRSRWAEHEFKIKLKDQLSTVGFRYRLVVWEGKEERRSEYVMVSEVLECSLAASAGVRMGDIIVRVNNVKAHSVAQVQKTISKTKHGRVLLTVKRPPKHISHHMLQFGSSHQATPTSQRTTASGVSSDVEGEEGGAREEGDSISLQGVRGERALPTSAGQRSSAHPLDSKPAVLPRDTSNVDEEDGVVKQTGDVEVCRSPRWTCSKFRFNVGPQHHYLNLCVYDRLRSEERGELLIGHVTLPLMDVALECLASSSGRHQQRYVLLAPELTRATSSRAAVQASEGKRAGGRERVRERIERTKEEEKKFVGSVLMRFKHSTLQDLERTGAEEEEEVERETGEEICDSTVEGDEGEESQVQHQFQVRELEGSQKCDICRKRIWALKGRVLVCAQCGVQCHKKCLPLSHQRQPCRRATVEGLCLRESRGFQIYEDQKGEAEDGEHRSLQQQTSEEGFVAVPPADEDFVRVEGEEDEKEASWKTAAEPDGEDRESSDSERSSDEPSTGPESEEEEATEQELAELLACQMLSHLPEPETERHAAIRNKVEELEAEVARAEDVVSSLQAELSGGHGDQDSLRRLLRQHGEKLQPLRLMKEQYSLALQQMTSTISED